MVKQLLLVEDDNSDARLLMRAFDKVELEANIRRVKNGEEAIAYLRGDSDFADRVENPVPGMVLLDLKLPRASGFEVLSWVRRQPTELHRLPVVVLSSSDRPADIDWAYELGANSYLTKPITSEEYRRMAAAFRDYWLEWNQQPSVLGKPN